MDSVNISTLVGKNILEKNIIRPTKTNMFNLEETYELKLKDLEVGMYKFNIGELMTNI